MRVLWRVVILCADLCTGAFAAEPDVNALPPAARAAAMLVRACVDPSMAQMLIDTFNRSQQRPPSLTAVGIDAPAEVAADSALARSLNLTTPPHTGMIPLRYCKARVQMNTGAALAEIFRIDIAGDGRTQIAGAMLTEAMFGNASLSEAVPLERPKAAPAGAAPSQTRALPSRTVLCGSESDYVRRQEDLAQTLPTHKIGLSCFFLEQSTRYTATGLNRFDMAQVRILDGLHAGAVAWTERSLLGN